MYQIRLSWLFFIAICGVILSFINSSYCSSDQNSLLPHDIYRYEHQKLSVNGKNPIIYEIHLLHRKERVRRDTEEDPKNYNTTKSQDADIASKVSTNPDSSDLGSSDVTSSSLPGSATSHKTQTVVTKTLDIPKMNKTAEKFDTDLSWDHVDKADTVINKTFEAHNTSIGNIEEDSDYESNTEDHKYYLAEKIEHNRQYVDLDNLSKTNPKLVKEHPMLSRSYRRAATIPLTFNFPFYGHEVRNITIATGGFLYTGDYVHSWLAATQYIAPLMANFDTSSSPDSKIRYADNGTSLIVEWLNVKIQTRNGGTSPGSNGNSDKNSYEVKGQETYQFQVVLHKSGDIVFAYKTIPTAIELLKDNEHPVKVGLSDAYIIDRTIFFVRRKTIYEYHRINKMKTDIKSGVAIWFRAQKTCNVQKSCDQCVKQSKCNWCQKLGRCSDGMDRLRQEWLMAHCDEKNAKTPQQCKAIKDNPQIHKDYSGGSVGHDIDHPGYSGEIGYGVESSNEVGKEKLSAKGHYEQATITTISIVALIALSIMVWFVYAYFFPHSWSGQLLIKYRPSRWQWRRGEPRYTAASIHM